MVKHDLIRAQDKLENATDFAHDIGMPVGSYPSGLNTKIKQGSVVRRDVGMRAMTHAGELDVDMSATASIGDEESRHSFNTYVALEDRPGTYVAKLEGHGNWSSAQATIVRGGVVHQFCSDNAERAAELIISLGAKRLGVCATVYATERIEKISDALERFSRP